MITIEGLWHVAGQGTAHEAVVLADVSLAIGAGEYVAVMGANGSGKSTLVKHFNGLIAPTRGTVRVDGLDPSRPSDLWAIRGKVGMVFQNPDHQMVSPVVEEEVAFGLENLRRPPDEIRAEVDRALAAVGLEDFRLGNPGHLSGGQKQRIAIASILAMRPQVIVLDEPTAMLDPHARSQVMASVREIHEREEMTVVLVTHSVEEARAAGRVVVLEGGRVAADGPSPDVLGDVETLERLSLALPPSVELARALEQGGLPLDEPAPRGPAEAAAAILRAVRRRRGEGPWGR